MARIKNTIKNLDPLTVDKFLGLNMPIAGDTQLRLGESGNMNNCYITKDYNLAKVEGYKQLMTVVSADKSIQGTWHGNINGKNYFLFACNGHIYRFNDNYWLDDTAWGEWATNTIDLGTLTDAPTNFFSFGGNVYIVNGYEYKKWTGTGTIQNVIGYIPKIRVGCKPSTGAGTEYEGINVLIGSYRISYKADNTKIYKLPETSIESVDKVYVYGTLKTIGTDYTVNLTTGIITFVNNITPVADEDDVEIQLTKGLGQRDKVMKNKFSYVFSQAVDSRVFLYGHRDIPNQRIYSSLANGIASAEYFTEGSIDLIGSQAYTITDIKQQQASLLVYTNQPATYISNYDVVDLDGISIVNFPTSIINETRGNIAMGQTQILDNDPFTIDTTLIKWYPTQTKDERNMKEIGARIQKDLNEYNLSKAKTVDFQNRFEMWIAIGKKVWIYNYKLDVFSRLELDHEPTCFLIINGELYFGTTTAKIMKFSKNYLTFNGKSIPSHWEMNMYDFGANHLMKTLNKSWITLAPQAKASVDLKYVTDKDGDPIVETKKFGITTFDNVDFSNFTFITNFNPQAMKIKLKSKKFTYLKLVIDNISAIETFVILSFTLQAEYGGQVK